MKYPWIVPLIAFACLSSAMRADILDYRFILNQSGSLDGVSFGGNYGSGALVTFDLTADSANVTTQGGLNPIYSITGPVAVSVAGVGADTITDSVSIYQLTGQVVFGLMDNTTGSGFDYLAFGCYGGCGTYDYLVGPLTQNSGPHSSGGAAFNTAHGSLVLTNSQSSPPHFQITEADVISTPEPSSIILLGSGALGLLTVLRRRRLK